MAVLPGADPDVGPGRGDPQCPHPLEHLRVGQVPAVLVEVLESATAPLSPVTGLGGVAVAEPHRRLGARPMLWRNAQTPQRCPLRTYLPQEGHCRSGALDRRP